MVEMLTSVYSNHGSGIKQCSRYVHSVMLIRFMRLCIICIYIILLYVAYIVGALYISAGSWLSPRAHLFPGRHRPEPRTQISKVSGLNTFVATAERYPIHGGFEQKQKVYVIFPGRAARWIEIRNNWSLQVDRIHEWSRWSRPREIGNRIFPPKKTGKINL